MLLIAIFFGIVILIEAAPVPGTHKVTHHTTHTTHHTSGGGGGETTTQTKSSSSGGSSGGGGGDDGGFHINIKELASTLNVKPDDITKAFQGDFSGIATTLGVSQDEIVKVFQSGDMNTIAETFHTSADSIMKLLGASSSSGSSTLNQRMQKLASVLNVSVDDLAAAFNGDLSGIANTLGVDADDILEALSSGDVNVLAQTLNVDVSSLADALGLDIGAAGDVDVGGGDVNVNAGGGGDVNVNAGGGGSGGLPGGIDLTALGIKGPDANGEIYIPDIPGIDRNVPGIVNHKHHMNLNDPAFHGVENDRCREGLIDGVFLGLRDGLDDATSGLMDVIDGLTGGGALLGPIGTAAETIGLGGKALLQNFFDGTFSVISDAACGLGDMGDTFASALDTGDILAGLGEGGKEFIFGMGSMLNDAGSHFIGGIDSAVDHIGNWVDDPFTGF